MTLVLMQREGPLVRLTLNDPDRANVLSVAMMTQLADELADAQAAAGVRVIVLGAAGRIFSAGHDLAELTGDAQAPDAARLFDQCAALMMAIGECRVPVIAKVAGAAVAAGCQLVASCDLAFASERAKFAVSGINLGLFCSTPGVALGRAVGRKAAAELLLTGRQIDGRRAAELGLINAAVPEAELDAVVEDAAGRIAEKPPEAIALGKAAFRRQMDAELPEAYAIAGQAMVENLRFRSAQAGIRNFLSR